ncbi:MAG: exopolyphosphatase [Bacteroidetes bacterium]|nr:exopolyphosphatase [Bacteroidota bacterium]
MKFASIDIGSNAIRLLFCNVYDRDGEILFKKEELIRVPIRLGEDAFTIGKISNEKKSKLLKAMHAFKLLIDVNEPIAYRACATSAMRDSSNANEIIDSIRNVCGIEVEVIDGGTEAFLIYENHIAENLEPGVAYLYVDVGGGSTELTLFKEGKTIFSRSFNIGTIRMLNNQVEKSYWSEFKNWIATNTAPHQPMIAIGSGGNINKIQRLAKRAYKPITYAKLQEIYDEIMSMSVKDRIEIMGLKPDRADVIAPAAKIFLTVMKQSSINYIVVPEIGLSDGIIHDLYEKHIAQISAN